MASISSQSIVSQSLTFAPETFPSLDIGMFEVRETNKEENTEKGSGSFLTSTDVFMLFIRIGTYRSRKYHV